MVIFRVVFNNVIDIVANFVVDIVVVVDVVVVIVVAVVVVAVGGGGRRRASSMCLFVVDVETKGFGQCSFVFHKNSGPR